MNVPSSVFREYDIRGHAEAQLTDEFFYALGIAFSNLVAASQLQRPTIALGRDCRLSSPRLHQALLRGLKTGGVNVIDIGVGPTPLLYFAVHHLNTDAGIMITGSHNPAPENGAKMLYRHSSIYGEEIQRLRAMVEAGPTPYLEGFGQIKQQEITTAYIDWMKSHLKFSATSIPFVVDAGNGAAGPLAIQTMQAMGLKPIPLYCEMDGSFPNHHPDPTQPENVSALQQAVKQHGATVGIAYDGDGDRLGAIDANGDIIWGDRLLALFARDILKDYKKAAIIGEVKCSQVVYDDIARHGGRPIVWKTGHSLIKTKMKQEHALLAGEMSGHLFFADRYFGYDDAIYASLRLLELLVRENRTIGQLLADLPSFYSTPEIRIDCPDSIKFQIVADVLAHFKASLPPSQILDIDGVRIVFEDGWGLVRASNTQPALVVRFEAKTPERLNEIQSQFNQLIASSRTRFEA